MDAGVRQPELLIIAVSAGFADKLGDVGALARSLIAPKVLLGVAVEAVADGELLATDAGMAMLAWTPSRSSSEHPEVVTALRVGPDDLAPLAAMSGSAAVLFADPFSVDASELTTALERSPVERFNGGFVSTARRRGASRLLVGDQLYSDGVVGFAVSVPHAVTAASSGGALMGPPVRLDSTASVVTSIGGAPAVDAYASMLADLGSESDVVDAVELGLLHLAVLPPGVDPGTGRSCEPQRAQLAGLAVPREYADTVRVIGLELVDGEPVGLRVATEVPSGAHGYLESFLDWSQESDLARQRNDLGMWGSAAVLVADPTRVGRSPMYRSGDHGELSYGATIGLVCSEVFERYRGAVRCSTDRLVVTGLSDS